MKNRYFLLLNMLVALCTAAVIFANLSTPISQARYPETQPGAAAP